MKILYLTDVKPDEFNLLQILGKQYEHDLHLIGGRDAYRYADDVTLHDSQQILVNLGKIWNRLKIGGRGFFVKHSGLVTRLQPDLIHALSVNTWGAIASVLPQEYPFVLTCTGSDIFRFPFQSKRVFQQVRDALHRADCVHVLSAPTVAHLVTHFQVPEEKIYPSPWGINVRTVDQTLATSDPAQTRASLGLDVDDLVVFAPRGMRPVFKPIGDLVEIMAPLMNHNHKLKLVIMMHVREDQELESKIRQDIAHYGFEDRVVIIEQFLPHSEMIKLFQAADITISLAESDETSLAALEAMYCGTIPVLSETLTYPSVLTEGKNAFFVQNGRVEEARSKISNILQHLDQLRPQVQEANKLLIRQEYDRHQNIHKIEQIYQKACQIKHDSQS